MEYTKIQHADARTLLWRLASVAARGAAVSLQIHCSDLENDGRLAGAKAYGDVEWQTLCAVTRAEVEGVVAAGLARWEGADLVLAFYDHRGQEALHAKRTANPTGAGGGRPPKRKTHGKTHRAPGQETHAETPIPPTPPSGVGEPPPPGGTPPLGGDGVRRPLPRAVQRMIKDGRWAVIDGQPQPLTAAVRPTGGAG